jgi:hypothetical protein
LEEIKEKSILPQENVETLLELLTLWLKETLPISSEKEKPSYLLISDLKLILNKKPTEFFLETKEELSNLNKPSMKSIITTINPNKNGKKLSLTKNPETTKEEEETPEDPETITIKEEETPENPNPKEDKTSADPETMVPETTAAETITTIETTTITETITITKEDLLELTTTEEDSKEEDKDLDLLKIITIIITITTTIIIIRITIPPPQITDPENNMITEEEVIKVKFKTEEPITEADNEFSDYYK